MAQTMVNFRMDEELKRGMEQACSDMGMSMTTAFTIFAKKVARERRIPFEVSAVFREEPNEETRAAIQEIQGMKKHPEQYKRYASFSEILDEVVEDA